MNYHLLAPNDLKELSEFDSKSIKKKRKCSINGCHEPAIFGHVFPGVYFKNLCINDNNHIYIHEQNTYLDYVKTGYVTNFTRMGIQKISRNSHGMKVFCNLHDHSIYRQIEINEEEIFKNPYKSAILFAHKSLSHEIVKMENSITKSNSMKESKKYSHLHSVLNRRDIDERYSNAIPQLNDIKKKFDEYLSFNKELNDIVKVEIFTIPKIEFFLCACLGFNIWGLFHPYFLSVIPLKNETLIISIESKVLETVGVNYEFPSKNLDYITNLKRISDVAIKFSETWGCSENFFDHNIHPQKSLIREKINYYKAPYSKDGLFLLKRKNEPVDNVNLFNSPPLK